MFRVMGVRILKKGVYIGVIGLGDPKKAEQYLGAIRFRPYMRLFPIFVQWSLKGNCRG